jgi:hypothetical protein
MFDLTNEGDEQLPRLIDLYKSHFVAVFCVSALTGDNVDGLFWEAARIASDSGGESTAEANPPEIVEQNRCC